MLSRRRRHRHSVDNYLDTDTNAYAIAGVCISCEPRQRPRFAGSASLRAAAPAATDTGETPARSAVAPSTTVI